MDGSSDVVLQLVAGFHFATLVDFDLSVRLRQIFASAPSSFITTMFWYFNSTTSSDNLSNYFCRVAEKQNMQPSVISFDANILLKIVPLRKHILYYFFTLL